MFDSSSNTFFIAIIIFYCLSSTTYVTLTLSANNNVNNNIMMAFAQNQTQSQSQDNISSINTTTTNTTCDFSFVAPDFSNGTRYAAVNNNNNTCPLQSYYQAGPIPDPNDNPTHVKAQQQFGNYTYTKSCDKGNGYPLCYNLGYYAGVAEANDHNSYHGMILYSPVCPSPYPANFCAGYIQGYSHTYAGHISNASEIWGQGYVVAYFNGVNMDPNHPIINGTNPASCNEGPPLFCDGYAQGYPHGIEFALGNELGAKAADNDWNLKGANLNLNATEIIIPSCPPGHTTDWCDGLKQGYTDTWADLSDTD